MKLFTLLLNHEIRQLRRERTMVWIAGFFFCLLCFGAYEGYTNAQRSLVEQHTLQSLTEARLESLHKAVAGAENDAVDMTPYAIGGKTAKRYMFKEPAALALLSVGHSNIFESQYGISLRDPDFTFLSAQDNLENPLLTSLGNFDFAFVIVWLLPLLIILYMYNIVSHESEIGTLRLILSNPLSLKKYVAVKGLVKFTLLTTFASLSVLSVLLIFTHEAFLDPLQVLYVLLLVLLYISFWFLTCILVNLFRHGSITNISILFVVFLSVVLIIPTITGLVADYMNPIPSRMELINVLRNATSEIDNDSSKLLDEYYFDHPELMPEGNVRNMAQYVYKNALKNKLLEEATRPEVEAYYSQAEKQMEAVQTFIYTSPAIGVYACLDALAQNGLADYTDFQKRVDISRREWRQLFEMKIFKDELMSADEIVNLPKPVYHGQNSVAADALNGIVGLILANVLALALIFFQGAFRKY